MIGMVIALAGVLIFRSCAEDREKQAQLRASTALIQEQVRNVSKLIVSEGHFAEVYNYHDSQQLFGPFITAQKKALVVVNAEVTVAYDLRAMEFQVDSVNRTLHIKHIPEPEVKVNPDLEYYDVSADYFNPFSAADYNQIKDETKALVLKRVRSSDLMDNAENRLISELGNLFILTNSMGWTLEYEGRPITEVKELRD